MVIENEEAAARLAKALCHDIVLYEGGRVKALAPALRGNAIAPNVAEGRELFVSRVAPALVPVYERAVAEVVATALEIDASTIVVGAPAHPQPQPQPQPHPAAPRMTAPVYGAPPHMVARGFDLEPTRRKRPRSNVPIIAGLLFLALGAASAWYLSHMHW